MKFYPPQSAAASKIVVTSTASTPYDLINTAGSTTNPRAGFPADTNAILIAVETNDCRVLFDSTPTATNGFLLTAGSIYPFYGVELEKMKLIRTGADCTCSVLLGYSDRGDAGFAINY